MAQTKQYGSADDYEKKLERVMTRLGVERFDWNWDRHGCWVQFWYKGQMYQFDHSVQKAKDHGVNLRYGSDAFAQIVLALEELARMVERGIYDLQVWVEGMKYLPPPMQLPWFLTALQFERPPASEEEIKTRYRSLAKVAHPDGGGSEEQFKALTRAHDAAMQWLKEGQPS